jgi:iron complex outermembrane recepter protein
VFPFRVDQPTFYGVSGNIARFGTYNFYDPATGKSYGTVQQLPPTGAGQPLRFIPNGLSLPGGDVLPNALFYNPNPYGEVGLNDVMDQLSLTKKLDKMSFTGGMYYSSTKATRTSLIPSAQSFATVEDRPKAVAIKYTNLAGASFDLTTPTGLANLGASGFYSNDARITQTAFFFGHNWQITDKLNLDWGLRSEKFVIDSKFTVPRRLADNTTGGADGNLSTLYDVRVWQNGAEQSFKKDLSTVSYSAGLNYQVNSGLAFYGRYSQGRKSPDLSYFMDVANQQLTSTISIEAQSIQMAELGLKLRQKKLNLFVTPFYTLLGNVPNFQIFQNPDVTYYAPPRVYQKIRTTGVELEGNYQFTPSFGLRAVGVFQGSKALDYAVYLAKTNGPADDEKVTFSGNENDNIGTMLTITPSYSAGKFTASLNYQYMGKRWANVGNAFQLPAFSAFDLNLSYRVSKHLQLNGSINNVLNTYGIMGWAAPGGFPAALDTQGFTKGMLEANPQAIYATLPIMPRAYFLTASYKF